MVLILLMSEAQGVLRGVLSGRHNSVQDCLRKYQSLPRTTLTCASSTRHVRDRVAAQAAVGVQRGCHFKKLGTRREHIAVMGSLFAWTLYSKAGEARALDEITAAPRATVLVAGATGKTGILTLTALLMHEKDTNSNIVAGARTAEKGRKTLEDALGVVIDPVSNRAQKDSTGRGPSLEVRPLDVEKSSGEELGKTLAGVDTVVSCIGFTPGNPFKFGEAAHAVDNIGTVRLIDAAAQAGVKRFVLMTSILTNGRAIGQENSAGFRITNAFGGVLDEKLVAEKHLRGQQKMSFAIVRPAGLMDAPKSGQLAISSADRLFSGEISRELVANVLVEAAFGSRNNVVEVVETGTCAPGACPDDLEPASKDHAKWLVQV